MSTELGRMEKPDAEPYRAQRKLYLVPLIFSPGQPSPDFADLVERYWRGVREHLLKLEASIGTIARVYHEGIGVAGEEGVEAAQALNEESGITVRSKVVAGASFEAVEDQELASESLDWQRCLLVGLESRKASEQVWGFYSETLRRRYELMAKRIDESLKPEEAGLLFLSEEHRVQFPSDVRVFYVAPPALDEIHRWVRDRRARAAEEPSQKE